MKITNSTPDAPALAELGRRLRAHRLLSDQTQQALAREAGVSKRTVERLEAGHSVQTETLLRVMRALAVLGNLDALVPAPLPSPLPTARRQRASGTEPQEAPWTWGDE